MNVHESRDTRDDSYPGSVTDGPSGALLSMLTTEHYTLQSARSSTIVEANGRSMLFLSAASGATVALALVAQLDGLGQTFRVFAFTVLPALLALGLLSGRFNGPRPPRESSRRLLTCRAPSDATALPADSVFRCPTGPQPGQDRDRGGQGARRRVLTSGPPRVTTTRNQEGP